MIEKLSGKTPAALLSRPTPIEETTPYIEAFILLSKTRKSSEAISLSDIFLYADTILEDRLEFAKIITAGDFEFLDYHRKKQEVDSDANEKLSRR